MESNLLFHLDKYLFVKGGISYCFVFFSLLFGYLEVEVSFTHIQVLFVGARLQCLYNLPMWRLSSGLVQEMG